ncbi:MAG TPA: hypothetical protein VFR47_25210 [Anaerolineales bacterium]|nr:hypothetical protein [Anaerolineales bacterium]
MNVPRLIRFTQGLRLSHETILLTSLLVVASCTTHPASEATMIPEATPTPTTTAPYVPVSPTLTPESASPTPFICDENWQLLPVIPDVPEAARILYQQGLAQGNNARAFSKIGDGEVSTDWFLTAFDLGEEQYDVGSYQNLKTIIETFRGSYGRSSVAARRGFNTHLILDSAASDPKLCQTDESPLDCELRIHNPSVAILSLGTNQVHRPEEFEAGMHHILDALVSKKVLPILSTKGDNLEGDHRINRAIACLAQEYQIPLWNFWAAIQPLPDHGLQPDLEHLTYSGINDFDDPTAMQSAWTVRNLTALQVLDAVWRAVAE